MPNSTRCVSSETSVLDLRNGGTASAWSMIRGLWRSHNKQLRSIVELLPGGWYLFSGWTKMVILGDRIFAYGKSVMIPDLHASLNGSLLEWTKRHTIRKAGKGTLVPEVEVFDELSRLVEQEAAKYARALRKSLADQLEEMTSGPLADENKDWIRGMCDAAALLRSQPQG